MYKNKYHAWIIIQALNFALEGAQQLLSSKEHLYEDSLNLYCNFAKGTTAKAQGITVTAVGAMG